MGFQFENFSCWLLNLMLLLFFVSLSLVILELRSKLNAMIIVTLFAILFYFLLDFIFLTCWENLIKTENIEEARHFIKSYSFAKEDNVNIFAAFLSISLWLIFHIVLLFKFIITNSKE